MRRRRKARDRNRGKRVKDGGSNKRRNREWGCVCVREEHTRRTEANSKRAIDIVKNKIVERQRQRQQ